MTLETTVKATLALIGALIGLSIFSFLAAPARADDALPPLRCFVGASAGTAAMATKVDSVVRIDVGGTAPLLSAETGCKFSTGNLATIAILRADLQRLGGSLDTATIQSNARYQGIVAAIIPVNHQLELYVGPSLTMSRFSIKDWQSTNVTGYGVVVGAETAIGTTGLRGFLEYGYTSFKSWDAAGAATVKPSESIARLGIRYGF